MGCMASRLDSDVVIQCRERSRLIKNAVKGRQEFAVAHAAYIDSLQNVGLAMRRLSEGAETVSAGDTMSSSSPQSRSSAVRPLPLPAPSPVCILPLSPPPSSSQSSSSSSSTSSPPPPSPRSIALQPPPPPLNLASPPPSPPPDLTPPSAPPVSPSPPHSSGIVHPDPSFLPSPSPKRYPPPAMPSPSANLSSSSWFMYDIFDAPPIPYNLLEHRRKIEDEEAGDSDRLQKGVGLPDLEEEQEQEQEKGSTAKEGLRPCTDDAAQDGVVKDGGAGEKGDKICMGFASDARTTIEELRGDAGAEEGSQRQAAGDEVCADEQLRSNCNSDHSPVNELALVTATEARELTGAVRHIHGHFARASLSGKDVSCMLETQTACQDMSLISSAEDSSKVFNAITSHWSRKTSAAVRDAYCDSHIPECGMLGSQASTLDRICAWEKKLYEEVKAGELIRALFDRKCQQLQHLEAKGTDRSSVDKIRMVVKKLDTQLMVALKAISQASRKIQKLSNEELYPQLVELLGGLMHMWKVMCECHRAQQAIASEMQTVNNFGTRIEGNEAHLKAIAELERELGNWRTHFQRWITSQKNYVFALNAWLAKCHTEPERGKRKGRRAAPSVLEEPMIFVILKSWCKSLQDLEKEQSVVEAISNFSEVVHFLRAEQVDDGSLKRLEGSSSFKTQDKKYLEYKEANGDTELGIDSKRVDAGNLENFRQSQLEYHRKEKILSRFREHLPYVFESMALFARDVLKIYESVQQANRPTGQHDEKSD